MALVVQKYGGSSVADAVKMRKVAERIAATRAAGRNVCVVVSAMGDTTDELLALAKQVSPAPPRRELDMLLSAGERISMALLSMALQELGVPAISFTGSQSGIITTGDHAAARIVEVRPQRVEAELARGKVVIVAGYQGVSRDREVTTLGRGGSDTTAVALAAALGADCEIYSDVAGVFTADPRIVPDARRLAELAYAEMQELAQAGAKVLNAGAVDFARAAGIAIHARSTFGGAEETVVRAGEDAARVSGVAVRGDLALLSAPAEGLPALLAVLARHGAAPAELASAGGRATVVVSRENVHGWEVTRAVLLAEVPGLGVEDTALGALSAVGAGLTATPRALAALQAALAEAGAAPRALFTSPLRVTALAPEAALTAAARALHRALLGVPDPG